MAVKEAEENDILDDNDDDENIDPESVSNGTTNKKSKSSTEFVVTGGKSQHKCGRKPTVCYITLLSGGVQSIVMRLFVCLSVCLLV